jgi:hypothetical protein
MPIWIAPAALVVIAATAALSWALRRFDREE